MRTSLFWYTKDLRLDDLPGLARACRETERVIPVYIWDDEHLEEEADNRKAFVLGSLQQLDHELRTRGSGLVLRQGGTEAQLIKLCDDHGAQHVFCSASRDPATAGLQRRTEQALRTHQIELRQEKGNYLLDPKAISTLSGGVYKVFTPFRNAALKTLRADPAVTPTVTQLDLPPVTWPEPELRDISPLRQRGGLREAETLWQEFVSDGLEHYATGRNDLANERGTSKLSAHLNHGTISVHRVLRDLNEIDGEGRDAFVNELLWREFNYYIAYHFPDVLHTAFKQELALIRWPGKPEHLEAWKEGRTGYPVVDAAMRELRETGRMHNRARMIVASFLVKDLLIDWRSGEEHFFDWLTDGDQVQNNAGWQWSASTGVDAQPYFRIFNPITQGKRFDATGEYVRRYLPELRHRSNKTLHDVNLDDGYPKAIVDHARQREQALALFKQATERHRT
ncbi:MAG TPA: deoxyribodipyrimidine photo-lyase [Candidatus Kapabacteria bacterium]|nr:deoxyribodipyrimidine photo-lyase [Candidatus Kapabacteria bacterium]